ncbi:MAG: nucleoside monophosphate kinase [Acidimicrobiales bacterium]
MRASGREVRRPAHLHRRHAAWRRRRRHSRWGSRRRRSWTPAISWATTSSTASCAQRLAADDIAEHGFVLDGYPRTVAQAEALVQILGDDSLHCVVDLDVPLDEVTERMKARGRDDDTDEGIARRLELYEQETRPVLDWFAARSLLIQVDGLADEATVTERLFAAI